PKGRVASPGDLSDAGFTSDGITKGSLAANMMSNSDRSASSRGVVPGMQSAGARGQTYTGENTTRTALDHSGFGSGGIRGSSVGSGAMSSADKSGSGMGVVSANQSIGARK
ncbi:hypothetical protein CGJ15_25895, partial [Vibrio parahaemolyticus]